MTGDNASNNDSFIEELSKLIALFPGISNQVRCFLHTLALSAKGVLRQFEVKPAAGEETSDTGAGLSRSEELLRTFAAGLEQVNLEDLEDIDVEGLEDVDLDAWVAEQDDLSAEEQETLRQAIFPIRLLLVKVNTAHRWLFPQSELPL